MIKIARKNLVGWATTLAVLFLLIQVACDLYLPTVTSELVDKGIMQRNFAYIWKDGIYMLVVAAIGLAAAAGNVYFAATQAMQVGEKLRQQIFHRILRFSSKEINQFGDSSLITRSTNDIVQIQNVMVQGGHIYLDGQDTRSMTRDDLRKHIGMVLQDTWLFTGTIFENIKYGREDATAEEVYRAAKMAYADSFIRELPDGYQTVLNESASNISQGQRQLLTIARAFLANPEILILDEATSSVDTRTEALIQTAMNDLQKNRTSFVVAHRLSTIRNAEQIVVVNHGHIIETGNHDQLMAKNGFYADLYNSQFLGNNI